MADTATAVDPAQLLEIFELFSGRVPAFELQAAGYDCAALERERWIYRSPSHLDGGCYLMGERLLTRN